MDLVDIMKWNLATIFDSVLNHLFSMHPFSNPLKTSENRKVFWCLQRVEKGCIGNEWVKKRNLATIPNNSKDSMSTIHLFLANVSVLYPQKTTESLCLSVDFSGYKVGTSVRNKV